MRPIEKFRRFGAAQAGVAAVEFALVFPLLLVLYLGTVEVTTAISVHRKVDRVAASIADLLGRHETLRAQDIDRAFSVGRSLMYPDDGSDLRIRVAGVRQKDENSPRTTWTRASSPDVAVGAEFVSEFPYKMSGSDEAFVILVSVEHDYSPIGRYGYMDAMTMNGVSAAKARRTADLVCENC